MQQEGGTASGTVDILFDADGDGIWKDTETVTIDVQASAVEVQAALRALGGFLVDIEVSLDSGLQRARNGGETWGSTTAKLPQRVEVSVGDGSKLLRRFGADSSKM